jgi:pyochelin synthetase
MAEALSRDRRPSAKQQALLDDWRSRSLAAATASRLESIPSAAHPLPSIVPDQRDRHLPFPLTGVQRAYWIGRTGGFSLGNVSCHAYLEVEGVGLQPARFAQAWRRMIDRHDMLRAIVRADGQQEILAETPPYEVQTLDLRGGSPDAVARELAALRETMSGQVLHPDRWPLFDIRASLLDGGRARLHISIDQLIVDAWSLQILLRELRRLYEDPAVVLPPLELSFRDYVIAERARHVSAEYRRSQEYWDARLASLPAAPQLPLARSPRSIERPNFVRRSARLDRATWGRLQARAQQAGLTRSAVLLGSYADVVGAWSEAGRFMLGLTLYNRLPLHPQVNDIVGDFTSVSLLEVEHSAEAFAVRTRRLQEQLWRDLDHRGVSGTDVLRKVALLRGGEPGDGAPVVFTSALFEDATEPDGFSVSWLGDLVYGISQTAQVWLDHQVFEDAGTLVLNWDAVEDLFPAGVLDEMFETYCRLLHERADDDSPWHRTGRRLVPSGQLDQRSRVNATEVELSGDTLHGLFVAQVPRQPAQPAVVTRERIITYDELARRAAELATRVVATGTQPHELVGVVMSKGPEQVVAVLGALQARAAYLPIDPESPPDRLAYLLQKGEVRCVLTCQRHDETLAWPDGVERLCVDLESMGEVGDADQSARSEDLAYVIYTSGSTGVPKGVMIAHEGAVNTILDINRRFGVSPADRVLALSSLTFDLSVYDIFGTLAAGGTIVMPDASARRDPSAWTELIRDEGVTVWNSAPALMQMLLEHLTGRRGTTFPSLRLVLLSGDWIPVGLPEQVRRVAPNARVISLGGATEASIWSVVHPIKEQEGEQGSVPYGRPLANQTCHVLDEGLEPCPVLVPGQLFIGGNGLALGYWRDEAQTARSFIQHPLTGARLYRTGDRARYLPNGDLELLGREDLQVKINGHRVELEEIEVSLRAHSVVRDAIAAVTGEGEGRRLNAYVVLERGGSAASEELRQFLRSRLPEYMVPTKIFAIEAMPLTQNGKVDRKALSELALRSKTPPPALATLERGGVVAKLTRLVAEVLGRETVDPEANLLELGANSIDVVRIANRLKRDLDFAPSFQSFYYRPTVAALGEAYLQGLPGAVAPTVQPGEVGSPSARRRDQAPVLLDPEEREAFARGEPGRRPRDPQKRAIALGGELSVSTATNIDWLARRSHRRFALRPLPSAQFGEWLGYLRRHTVGTRPKYLYASAGGVYPVQTYLHVKAGRVIGLPAGIYYYRPEDHSLEHLAEAEVERDVHEPFLNRATFDEAAFSLFLIARLRAMEPLYGGRARDFCLLEAGGMAQLLMSVAPACGIGLCPVGQVDEDRIRRLFALDEDHELVHSLLGGALDPVSGGPNELATRRSLREEVRGARMLERIKGLSPEDLRALLQAQRGAGKRDQI